MPEKRINTALLSFGMSGKVFHAPFLSLHPGFNLIGSWERTSKIIAEHYPGVRSYSSLEELLEDKSIELVVVNTPTATHYEYAKKTLLAGKHAIVEKAFTTTVAEAQELKALSVRHERMLSVFQNRRWDSDFKTVHKVITEGLLGDIVEATLSYDRYAPALSSKVHKEVVSPGSGVVKDLAPHLVDQAVFLFGMPDRVFGDMMITRESSQVFDYFEILLYYKAHRVRLRSGYFVREPFPAYVIHGKKGSFHKTRADVQEGQLLEGRKPDVTTWGLEPDNEMGLLHTEKSGGVVMEKIQSLRGNYNDYFDGVYNAITSGAAVPVSADDGINVMRIIEAVELSNREGRVVSI